jgi:hypothetical protein
VDGREIKVIECPAEKLWANILTEPLQGMAFRKMRAKLMNCPVNYEENGKPTEKPDIHLLPKPGTGMKTANKRLMSTSPQECVGHKRTRLRKNAPFSLPRGSFLPRIYYLRILAEPVMKQ